jgi:esterase/lipase superfamily enzyme
MLRRVHDALFREDAGLSIELAVVAQNNNGVQSAHFEYDSVVLSDVVQGHPGCRFIVQYGIRQFRALVAFDPAAPASARYDLCQVDSAGRLQRVGESVTMSEATSQIVLSIDGVAVPGRAGGPPPPGMSGPRRRARRVPREDTRRDPAGRIEMPDSSGLTPASRSIGPREPPHFTVPVFFGTSRARVDGRDFYGTGRAKQLQYGVALASVPSERRLGDIPRPTIWTLYRENPRKHYLIREVKERSVEEFTAEAAAHMAASGARQAFVFIHGFNVSFLDAVLRTAQIAADLNFNGAPMLFTWPSKGQLTPIGYTRDENEAQWTVPYLAAFLRTVASLDAEAVHLIAHSMGNRVLTEALRRLRQEDQAGAHVFRELVLTAPDIDTDTFVNDIAPAILPTASRVTLYASSKDAALAFSKTVHGYPRLGDSGENLVTIEGVDTIDVTAVDTNLVGHFYYGDNRSVLGDLFNLIKGDRVPRFGLRKKQKDARVYWVFQP